MPRVPGLARQPATLIARRTARGVARVKITHQRPAESQRGASYGGGAKPHCVRRAHHSTSTTVKPPARAKNSISPSVMTKSSADGGWPTTNCGPASQPLLSGRSETRAQNADKPAARTSSHAVGFVMRGGFDRKSPARKRGFVRPPPGLPTLDWVYDGKVANLHPHIRAKIRELTKREERGGH
jgi:hypothetical protein